MRRLLDAAEYPIILISAPAGFGKTTSIKQFLARCDRSIFVSTPPSANTLSLFICAFSHGCSDLAPAMSSPPTMLLEPSISPEQELDLFVAWAIANLRAISCTIAIDDLQHTDDDPRVAEFLNRLTHQCGREIQWLFSSRTLGVLPRAQWQAYAKADAAITAFDLRMDHDEAFELASALGSSVTREQLSKWVMQTQGFPVPLSYAIRASARHGNVDELTNGMRSLTFTFLAEHLWKALQTDEREILELAAFLPPLRTSDYEDFGIDGAGARIAALTDDIAFISLDSASNFSMHDLFRDFVRQQVSARGSKNYHETARKAAALHLKSGRPLDALQIFIELGDTSALLNAIDSSPIPLHDLEITPILAAAIDGETLASLSLGALLLLTNHWTRTGLAAKGLRYAEELLIRPGTESRHLFCALKTISIFTHYYPAENQRAWLARLPDVINRLDESHYTQALAYRANYCCRFPDLANDSGILLKAVLGNLQNLEPLDRFGVFMVNASTYLFLDDRESALSSTRQAVGVAQLLDDSSEVVKALNMLGTILYHRCDSEFEIVSEQLRQLVVGRGIWRFSQASHWLPAEFYARCGNSQKALEASRLFDDVIVGDDTLRRLFLYFRRITAVLINLIDGKYPIILADIAKFGLPEDFAERYEIAIAAAFSHAFLGDDVRAAYYLLEAKASRERFGSLSDENGVFNRIYGEVIALCSVGRWFQAKRILSQQGEAFVGSPTFYEVLKLLSDGPPFAGVSATLRPFAARPYFGMLALLANRVIEKWSGQQKEPLLTAAETDVLRLIGLGKSNKDIANVRSRSTETVKRQVASLLRKLGVENRTSAVTVARERGLL